MSPQPSDPTPHAIPCAARDTPTRRYWVGCSGYFYRGWRGRFYPADLSSKDWLTYYAQHFNTVEINSTFYRFPTLAHLRRWGQEVSEGFVFALKAPRLITHVQRFNDPTSVATLYQVVQAGLAGHLGAVLFQFPLTCTTNPRRWSGCWTCWTQGGRMCSSSATLHGGVPQPMLPWPSGGWPFAA